MLCRVIRELPPSSRWPITSAQAVRRWGLRCLRHRSLPTVERVDRVDEPFPFFYGETAPTRERRTSPRSPERTTVRASLPPWRKHEKPASRQRGRDGAVRTSAQFGQVQTVAGPSKLNFIFMISNLR